MQDSACNIPVYLEGQSRNIPYTRVSAETAQEWLAAGIARLTTRRGRSLTLFARKALRLRGASCNITLHTILQALSGSKIHQAQIEAWRLRVA